MVLVKAIHIHLLLTFQDLELDHLRIFTYRLIFLAQGGEHFYCLLIKNCDFFQRSNQANDLSLAIFGWVDGRPKAY